MQASRAKWRDIEQELRQQNLWSYGLMVLSLIVSLVAMIGWSQAKNEIQISIPPQLQYGGVYSAGDKHPAEVYSFAGYIWQQLHTWYEDGQSEGEQNILKLSAYLTPQARAYLEKIHRDRSAVDNLKHRTRTIQPKGLWKQSLVEQMDEQYWKVELIQQVEERYQGVAIKKGVWKYFLVVKRINQDPEQNPWHLVLDIPWQAPQKLPLDQSGANL